MVQTDLFTTAASDDAPQGLVYQEAVLTAAEEATAVAAFSSLAFTPFAFHGYLGNRRVVSFGWRYDYTARRIAEAAPFPDFLMPLREKAAALAHLPASDFVQALVTEYAPGAGIGWHRDKPTFGDVAAVSFLAPCTLRFRRERVGGGGWERRTFTPAPRSAYLLRGEARTQWEHSIPPVSALRYSLTLRTIAKIGEQRPPF